MFQGSFEGVLRVFRVLVLRVFQWSFEGVLSVIQECFKEVSRVF